jgi:hypothetical protein
MLLRSDVRLLPARRGDLRHDLASVSPERAALLLAAAEIKEMAAIRR